MAILYFNTLHNKHVIIISNIHYFIIDLSEYDIKIGDVAVLSQDLAFVCQDIGL